MVSRFLSWMLLFTWKGRSNTCPNPNPWGSPFWTFISFLGFLTIEKVESKLFDSTHRVESNTLHCSKLRLPVMNINYNPSVLSLRPNFVIQFISFKLYPMIFTNSHIVYTIVLKSFFFQNRIQRNCRDKIFLGVENRESTEWRKFRCKIFGDHFNVQWQLMLFGKRWKSIATNFCPFICTEAKM